jgi:hypothetical protein
MSNTLAGQTLVHCEHCGDTVPHGHTLVRPDLGRICWFCYSDETVAEERRYGDDDDDWDDDDEEWDEDDWDDE